MAAVVIAIAHAPNQRKNILTSRAVFANQGLRSITCQRRSPAFAVLSAFYLEYVRKIMSELSFFCLLQLSVSRHIEDELV